MRCSPVFMLAVVGWIGAVTVAGEPQYAHPELLLEPTELATPDVILDARSEDEFCGINKRDNRRGGAIPGAKPLEWSDLIDQETQRFKSPAQLRGLFSQAGIDLGQPTACHCNGGGRAAVMSFGLELMGAQDVRNYYRGWGEWSNAENTPVIVPTQEEQKQR